jgi:hypothetical protein
MTGLALLSDKLSVTNELRLKNDEKNVLVYSPLLWCRTQNSYRCHIEVLLIGVARSISMTLHNWVFLGDWQNICLWSNLQQQQQKYFLTIQRLQGDNLTLSCTYAWTDQSLGCCNINTLYLFQRWSLFCRCRCFFNKCLSFFIFFCLVTAPYTSPVARC